MFKLNTLFTFLNLSLSTLILSLSLLSPHTYAADANNIEVNHCTTGQKGCGQVLVGAAWIDFGIDFGKDGGIRWAGPSNSVSSVSLAAGGTDFGFTGCVVYLMTSTTTTCPPGNGDWRFGSTKSVAIINPPHGAKINHFFAPLAKGPVSATHTYETVPISSKPVNVEGEGVLDDNSNPAIILTATAQVFAQDGTLVTDTAQPGTVNVKSGGKVIFTVVPSVNQNAFTQVKGNTVLKDVNYVLVKLQVTENNTQCVDRYQLSFQDLGEGLNRVSDKNNYYHYLERGGPSSTPQTCVRNYSFLSSVNTGFTFTAKNTRDTGSGNVEYVFYVHGHYDPYNPDENKYVGSWKKFQLNAYTTLPVANFNTIPTPAETHVGQTVTLDGSGSTPSTLGPATINKYQWNYQGDNGDKGKVESDSPKYDLLTFKNPGTYTVSLTVTDNLGRTSPASESQKITVWPKPVADFTTDLSEPLKVTLTSTSRADNSHTITNYDWQSYDWQSSDGQPLQGDKPSITFANAGTYTISLTVRDNKGGVSEEMKQTVNVWQAPSAIITPPNPISGEAPLTITLDGSGSKFSSDATKLTNYEWKDSNNNTICSNSSRCEQIFCQAGDHQITLIVTDDKERKSDAYTQKITVTENPYPSLDENCKADSISIDPQSTLETAKIESYSNAHFVGGMSIGSGNFLRDQTLGIKDFTDSKSTDVVTVKAEITVAPGHEDKSADILVLVNFTPYEKVPSHSPWYTLIENKIPQSLILYPFEKAWDEKLSKDSPAAFSTVTLSNPQPVEIFKDYFPHRQGTYLIYVGYRPTGDDQIIFGPNPIQFKIE